MSNINSNNMNNTLINKLKNELKFSRELIHLHENDEAPSGLRIKYLAIKKKYKQQRIEIKQLEELLRDQEQINQQLQDQIDRYRNM